MGADIRKKLFFTLAQKGWAMIGLEAVGMSLEDIFISVVDQTEKEKSPSRRYERSAKKRVQRDKSTLETELAQNMVRDATAKREEDSKANIEE